jgi:protein SCO1/2
VRALLFAACLALASCEAEPLPEMMAIGEFSLTDQEGRPFGSAQLAGEVWIADFVFTSCPDVCPVMTSQMANLSRRMDGHDVHFVSISVDPEHDTPERLREYAARYRADASRWHFLTGTEAQVRELVVGRFRNHVGEREDADDGRYRIMHGLRFVLVDGRGVVRGFYETDRAGLETLERDAIALVEER